MAKIFLTGLDSALADDLSKVLLQLGHEPARAAADADLVFAGPGMLREVLQLSPKRPVIVTSRLPEVTAWLNALEDGATDYCGAPFEPTQVRWLLNSALAA